MNPINLIISFIMAKSRANYYNIPESQDLTNTALLAGMVSENPILSYIIIDNKAKNDSSNTTVKKVEIENSPDSLPAKTETAPKENGEKTPEKTETVTATKPVENLNVITIENVRTEIDKSNDLLKTNLTNQLTGITTKVGEIEDINKKLTESVGILNNIFEAITKGAKIEVPIPIPNSDVLETPTKAPLKKNNPR